MKEELTIFYADDDYDDLDFFREIVESLGKQYTVVTQTNGIELLHALHNPPPQPYLIFLDINMPGMNGLETLERVRKSNTHKLLPIIMFSTSNDDDLIDKSRLLGATFYMQKSGDFLKLKNSIQHVLSINWGSFITTEQNFVYQH